MSASRPSALDVLMSNASNDFKKKKLPKPSSRSSKSRVQSLIRNSPLLLQKSTRKRNSPVQSLTCNSPLPVATENRQEISTEKKLKRSSLTQTGYSSKKCKILISPYESLLELKKKGADFDVKRAVYWGEGERVPFMFVVNALDAIKKDTATGRIAMKEIMPNLLRTVMETTPNDLLPLVYLLANRIAPAYEGLELGIGDAVIVKGVIVKALVETCGTSEKQIKKLYKEQIIPVK